MARLQPSFTLIELIVTVGIISMILSCLPYLLGSLTDHSDRAECLLTLNGLGKGFALYAQDHSDVLPHHDAGDQRPPYNQCWYDVLDPYLGRQPAHRLKQEPGMLRLHELQDGKRGHSYKMNSRLQDYKGNKTKESAPFRNLWTLDHPEETILIFDGDVEHNIKKHQPYGMFRSVENRHKGKASLLMTDFSAVSSSGGHTERYWENPGGFIWDGDLKAKEQ